MEQTSGFVRTEREMAEPDSIGFSGKITSR